jgi:hypothetical protein
MAGPQNGERKLGTHPTASAAQVALTLAQVLQSRRLQKQKY